MTLQRDRLIGSVALPFLAVLAVGGHALGQADFTLTYSGTGSPEAYTAVALAGDVAVLGAFANLSDLQGSAAIFRYDGSSWKQEASFVGSRPFFGSSVAATEDTVVVGDSACCGDEQGRAHLYRFDGSTWNHTLVTPSPGDGLNNFGSSVDAHGDRVIVSSLDEQPDEGAVYIYRYDEASGWSQEARLTLEDKTIGVGRLGQSVAIYGDTALAARSGSHTPIVEVFRRSGTDWTHSNTLLLDPDPDGVRGLALFDDVAVVHQQDDVATIYRSVGSSWNLEAQLFAPLHFSFGNTTVAAHQDVVLIPSSSGASLYRYDGTSWSIDTQFACSSGIQCPLSLAISPEFALLGEAREGPPLAHGYELQGKCVDPLGELVYEWDAKDPGDGVFNDAMNWDLDKTPGEGQIARFASEREYLVVFEESVTNERVEVFNDDVTFVLAGETYTLSPACGGPSVFIGEGGAESYMTVEDGAVMATEPVFIDAGRLTIGNGGVVDIAAPSSGAASLTLGPGHEGGAFAGSVDVENGGMLRTASEAHIFDGIMHIAGDDSQFCAEGLVVVGAGGLFDAGGCLLVDDGGRFLGTDVVVGGAAEDGFGLVEVNGLGVFPASQWFQDGTLTIGKEQMGQRPDEFNVVDATATIAITHIGETAESSGKLNVTGQTASAVVGVLHVGLEGEGLCEVRNQAELIATTEVLVGLNEKGRGELIIDGSLTRLETPELGVGIDGEGIVRVRNGGRIEASVTNVPGLLEIEEGFFLGDDMTAGGPFGTTGVIAVQAGALEADVMRLGFAGTGILSLNSLVVVTGDIQLGQVTSGAGLIITGPFGSLIVSGSLVKGLGGALVDTSSGGEVCVAGSAMGVSINAGLGSVQIGGSCGSSSLVGGAAVAVGALILDEDTTVEAAAIEFAGGTLGGTGTLAFDITSDGVLSPGGEPCTFGVFTIGGRYTQLPPGVLEIEIGAESDMLVVTEDADLAGALDVTVLGLPGLGDEFTILTASSVTGVFDTLGVRGPGLYEVVYEETAVKLRALVDARAADVDGDGVVGFTDLLGVLAGWGPCAGCPCVADIDGSGEVGFSDLLAVLAAWG